MGKLARYIGLQLLYLQNSNYSLRFRNTRKIYFKMSPLQFYDFENYCILHWKNTTVLIYTYDKFN